MQFHREVVKPDLEAIRDELRAEMVTRAEFLTHMDAIYQKLDFLQTEYRAIRAQLQRLEERVASIEVTINKLTLRSELEELKERVAQLEKQLN